MYSFYRLGSSCWFLNRPMAFGFSAWPCFNVCASAPLFPISNYEIASDLLSFDVRASACIFLVISLSVLAFSPLKLFRVASGFLRERI